MKLQEITQDNTALCNWLMQNAELHFGSGMIRQPERLLKLLNEGRFDEVAPYFQHKKNLPKELALPYGLPKARWISIGSYTVPDLQLDSVNGFQFSKCEVHDAVMNRIAPENSMRCYDTKIREDIFYNLVATIKGFQYHAQAGSLAVVTGAAISEKGYSKTAKVVVIAKAVNDDRTKVHPFDDVFEMQDWMIQNGFTGMEYFK